MNSVHLEGLEDLLRHVDPLIGTDSHHGFSTGNCLPLAAAPFGMTHWSPQTAEGPWFFDRRQRKLQGIRATHQPSPWIGDYGAFVVMPQTGELSVKSDRRSSAFRLDRSVVKPDYQCFDLIRYQTRMEATPTKRCALFRFTFPQADVPRRVIVEPVTGASSFMIDASCSMIGGFTRGNSGGCPDGFACYFVARFDKPIKSFGVFADGVVERDVSDKEGPRAGGYVEFDAADGPVVLMRVATSFISIQQAARNLQREIGDSTFEETHERCHRVWQETLNRIAVEDENEEAIRTFYTCLYRTQLFPRIWHEEDEANELVHFSPYDGQVHPGPLYTDNGFWDTYRTEYPLLSILAPGRLSEILEGWTNAYKEGGWFPQWASPGYRACMVGTHIDAVMADAVAKGITDFDLETALEGLLKHAFQKGDAAGAFGRIGIEDYMKSGYVYADKHDGAVARSLDYAYDDWCIAQVAQRCGQSDVAADLLRRSQSYRNSWDPVSRFMRARTSEGKWVEPFDPIEWGGPYVEGGAWQSTWAVPHDVQGLIELFGGPESFVSKLDEMLAASPHFKVGSYGFEIHEMTEMACADFGQYAHSNQPVHHVLYLFTLAGRPDRTQFWVRKVMADLYGLHGFPGDEDNGEMSAWYVLSALGIFPLCPGDPRYVLGSPLFRKVTIRPPGGKEFTVEAPDNQGDKPFVRSVEVNRRKFEASWIQHDLLREGVNIKFHMSQTA